MGLIKWVRLPFDLFGPNLKVLLQRDEDDLLEDDPIGEFLSFKAGGTLLTKDEEDRAEAKAAVESQDLVADGGYTEISEPSVLNMEQDLDEQEPVKEELLGTPVESVEEQTGQIEHGDTRIDMVEDENLQPLDAGDDVIDAAESMSDDLQDRSKKGVEIDDLIETGSDPQTAEVQSANIGEEVQSRARKPQEDGEVDSLLDVFRDEQLEDNPISILARGLDDTSVYSLLEETKRIADRVKKSSG